MDDNIPLSPKDRKQLLAAWHAMPEDKKESLYKAFQWKCCLFILQGWDEVPSHSNHNLEEKIHLLLAYKSLGWIWFEALPDLKDEPFALYVCDDTPEDQGPVDVNDTFDMNQEELRWFCKGIEKPEWAKKKKIKQVKVTIQSFPSEA